MFIFKKVVLFVQLISLWITNRPFGRVIYDINEKYDDIDLAEVSTYSDSSYFTLETYILTYCLLSDISIIGDIAEFLEGPLVG